MPRTLCQHFDLDNFFLVCKPRTSTKPVARYHDVNFIDIPKSGITQRIYAMHASKVLLKSPTSPLPQRCLPYKVQRRVRARNSTWIVDFHFNLRRVTAIYKKSKQHHKHTTITVGSRVTKKSRVSSHPKQGPKFIERTLHFLPDEPPPRLGRKIHLPASCLFNSSCCSVIVLTRNEPSLVKVVRFWLKVAVTDSFSRFCFFSKQAANAHPTAWLSLSPLK